MLLESFSDICITPIITEINIHQEHTKQFLLYRAKQKIITALCFEFRSKTYLVARFRIILLEVFCKTTDLKNFGKIHRKKIYNEVFFNVEVQILGL